MNRKHLCWLGAAVMACNLALMSPSGVLAQPAGPGNDDAAQFATKTPIKHVIVIFQENVSFDHYFGTYPQAENKPGEIPFKAKESTPEVNGLETAGLLTNNPNGVNPFRIPPSVPVTCDQDHNYGDEQFAFHGGLMDRFLATTPSGGKVSCNDINLGPNSTMGYYDGNTVTALWNYAQHFAMSDNSFGTSFGPSTPGAVNLVSGNTFGATLVAQRPNGTAASAKGNVSDAATFGAVIGDPRPGYDDCVMTSPKLQTTNMITLSGQHVGDLLNAKGITWGWFQGGFAPTGVDAQGRAICGAHQTGLAGDDAATTTGDYIPHHEPFMYYPQSTNQHHLRPSSPALIGSTDQANHQYDLADFFTALNAGRLPAVTFLKAAAFQDGHAGYSDPIDEQVFLVNTLNTLMRTPEWRDTAVIIAYDDSDGWYDHQMGPIVNQSNVSDDQLLGPGNCGTPKPIDASGTIQNGRCGYGPRMPLLVISPFAKQNYVDHSVTDQSSILRFIEDNWDLGRIGNGSTDAIAGPLDGMFDFDDNRGSAPLLILDPPTGQIVAGKR